MCPGYRVCVSGQKYINQVQIFYKGYQMLKFVTSGMEIEAFTSYEQGQYKF